MHVTSNVEGQAGANAVADIRTPKHSSQIEDNDHNRCVAEGLGHQLHSTFSSQLNMWCLSVHRPILAQEGLDMGECNIMSM
jgi:hypothetical protein